MITKRVGFIGAGNMAEAIVQGLLERQVLAATNLLVADPAEARCALFQQKFGLHAAADNRELVRTAEVVVLAVKPQMMAAALEPLREWMRPDHLVISIAAGVRTAKLDALLGGLPAIIRVMPNTPALVGRGVSAICAGPRANDAALSLTETLFAAVGKTLRVEEMAMDAVTAISGSGPAYVFYWMEAMLKAANEQGFDAATARTLVLETLAGATALAAASTEAPDVLRARVTSKGGTTEAALRVLEERGVGAALVAAIDAAARRSRELSN